MKYICDNKRHLICVPYTIENLHKMAKELDIKRCWFHKNHYDIPKLREDEIKKRCTIVSPKNIVEIILHPEYADIIISDSIPMIQQKPSNQVLPEHEELKYNGYSK